MAPEAMTALRGVLDGADVAALRATRLRALTKSKKRTLDEMLEALDALILALDERDAAIARGEAAQEEPVVDPGKDRESRMEARTELMHDTLVLPAVSETDLAEPEVTPLATEPMALEAATPEAVATESIEDGVVEDYEEMAAHGATAAAEEPMATPVPEPTLPHPVESHTVETPMVEHPAAITTEIPIPPDEAPTPGWTRPAELLFDDALRLFRMGDSDGALISLERLLVSHELNADLAEFVRVNEGRLLDLYAAIVGPWEKIPSRHTSTEPMPQSFYAVPKIAGILAKIDGKRSIGDLMATSGMSRLETVSVVNQLLRSKAITTESTLH